jgi:hypothetical protein
LLDIDTVKGLIEPPLTMPTPQPPLANLQHHLVLHGRQVLGGAPVVIAQVLATPPLTAGTTGAGVSAFDPQGDPRGVGLNLLFQDPELRQVEGETERGL